MGVTGPAAAAWLRTLERASTGGSRTDLVWSGPTVPGVAARDTGRVFEEIVRAAERTLWVSTYAYFDGPQVFGGLAERLDSVAGLRATLLLNIQRGRGDKTARDQLVRRFADQFWTRDWPGASRPAVYYDPRALDGDGPGGVLHAKAVVADGVRLFVTSANRDPEVFDRPDDFDVERYPNPHVAFGSGIHHCLGATLARLEGQEAFKALAERFPNLNMNCNSDDLTYTSSITFRTLETLPVSLS